MRSIPAGRNSHPLQYVAWLAGAWKIFLARPVNAWKSEALPLRLPS